MALQVGASYLFEMTAYAHFPNGGNLAAVGTIVEYRKSTTNGASGYYIVHLRANGHFAPVCIDEEDIIAGYIQAVPHNTEQPRCKRSLSF